MRSAYVVNLKLQPTQSNADDLKELFVFVTSFILLPFEIIFRLNLIAAM